MNDPTCSACRISSGAEIPPGGVVHREGGLLLHALQGPSPLLGWLVLTSERHVRAWPDLDPAALAALGPLSARVMRAQREVLGAEHVYAFAIGDVVRHFHLHLVPRYAGTPARLRGRAAFDASPAEALAAEEVAEAAVRVASAIASR